MGAECPKQYLPLAGQPLLRHALRTLAAVPAITRVFVVLAPDDTRWDAYDWSDLAPRLEVLRCGGATRAESVSNGLKAMQAMEGPGVADDWVLVHDAARACLTPAHVEKLIAAVGDDPVGGLLAVPLADTLKRAHETTASGLPGERVAATVPREGLWQAQTPQMFRHALLAEALECAPAVTDEASAVEALGLQPRLVAADAMNFKVTWPLDLQLAGWILQNRKG